ncbi:uncharacterized protein LOC131937117 [Physella acuta]|uniref:uncharacterized protein LOC131937117 n=1 Tax=Physella acuta TaxID=109671 RepID=UPI0027DBE3AD|nr:uncharacterized protein LOC131937117 [Physella acuta]
MAKLVGSGTGEMKESKAEHVNLIIYLSLGVSLFVLLCVAVMFAVKLWITRHHVKGNNRAKSPDPQEKTTGVKRAKVSPQTKGENPYYSEIPERALSKVLPHNEDVYAHIQKPVKSVFDPPQVKTQPNFYVRDWGHVQENFYHEIPEVKGKLPYDRDTLLEY